MKRAYIYIMTNKGNTTLYVGVTSDLLNRIMDHKTHRYPYSFTARYKLHKLVYYETFHSITAAISRENKSRQGRENKK